MMLPTKRQFFQLPHSKDFSDIFTEIEKQFVVVQDNRRTVGEQFLDSFDWRLFKNKLFLTLSDDRRLSLIDAKGNQVHEAESGAKETFFWWDFVDLPFGDTLKSALDVRAVYTMVDVSKTVINYRLLNQDDKTVARVTVSIFNSLDQRENIAVFSTLQGVRGYDSSFKNLRRTLLQQGAQQVQPGPAVFTALLGKSSRKPFDYSSKFSTILERDWSVAVVSSEICLQLLDTMKRNLQFVLQDVDTEFLHDFRVALRRTRSYLSLLKHIFPEEIASFADQFKWLGMLTGPVRDLDVYLLKKEIYSSMLPGALRPGLPYFFADIEVERQQAFEEMVVGLQSERFVCLMDEWYRYLADFPGREKNGNRDRLCLPEAVKIIHKRFRQLIKKGMKIDDTSEDKSLHELRLRAKKFRYVLEFYASFFDKTNTKQFVKQLKKLQDNLGDFNDLSVQKKMLEEYQLNMNGRSKRDMKVAASLGGLICHLGSEQMKVRKKFKRTFKQFINKENMGLFEQTFQA